MGRVMEATDLHIQTSRGVRPLFRDYDMGGGFKIVATNMKTWTRYTASQQSEAGYVVNNRCAEFCRRREANAQINAWKAES
jgi:predicted urease superfamily metal-dependent hydrolase